MVFGNCVIAIVQSTLHCFNDLVVNLLMLIGRFISHCLLVHCLLFYPLISPGVRGWCCCIDSAQQGKVHRQQHRGSPGFQNCRVAGTLIVVVLATISVVLRRKRKEGLICPLLRLRFLSGCDRRLPVW